MDGMNKTAGIGSGDREWRGGSRMIYDLLQVSIMTLIPPQVS